MIGYPHPYKNKYVLYESTGPVMSVEGSSIVYSAHTESGNSGSPVLNSNNELVGIHFASDVKMMITEMHMASTLHQKLKNSLQKT